MRFQSISLPYESFIGCLAKAIYRRKRFDMGHPATHISRLQLATPTTIAAHALYIVRSIGCSQLNDDVTNCRMFCPKMLSCSRRGRFWQSFQAVYTHYLARLSSGLSFQLPASTQCAIFPIGFSIFGRVNSAVSYDKAYDVSTAGS